MAGRDGEPNRPRSKVARLIDAYGLDGVGDELEARWTATGEDHWSLRDLADYFNKELIRARLHEAGQNPSKFEVENVYRFLSSDEAGDADVTQLRRRLEREGVDVDALERELVTYQAVRSYLKEYRGAEYERGSADQVEAVLDAVRKLRGRLVSVTETKLEQLRNTSRITLGEFHVMVDVRVLCTGCNTQYSVADLLSAGGCDCEE